MKQIVLALTLAFSGAQAHAARGISQAQLNQFFIQPGSQLAKQDISEGTVLINRYHKTITLTLQPAFHCPQPGMMCLMVMPAPIQIELPITNIKVGACRETIYTAEQNLLPVDGLSKKIEVIDNQNNYCEMYPVIPTVVRYSLETPRPYSKEAHSFHGNLLEIESAPALKRAELLTVQPQAHTPLAEKAPIGGEIQIDAIDGRMTLRLDLPGTCPKNVLCIWAGPDPIVYRFQKDQVKKGACGETITISKTQALEEGGPMATLTVTDYSSLVCTIFPAAWTEVELNVHGFVPERHTMTAEKLK